MALALRFAARSDVGLLRDGNEDSGYAGPRLLVVADGMGGHAAGEVASSVAVAAVAALDEDAPGPNLIDQLAGAVTHANDILSDMVSADPALEGMGTTLTAMLRSGTRLAVVHVGDSRCYLFRAGHLEQITHDHTFVQTLVDEGRITEEEASHHPQRSLITRALDGRGEVELDVSIREARAGDRYLLCSDGLSGVVTRETLEATLAEHREPDDACAALVDLALRGGGPDNVTCIVADVVEVEAASPGVPKVVGAAAEPGARAGSERAGRGAAERAAALNPRPGRTPDGPGSGENDARRRRWPLRLLVGLLAAAVVVAAGWGAYAWSQQQFFVGVEDGTTNVAVFRGINQDLFGLTLSEIHTESGVSTAQLSSSSRERVSSGIGAEDLEGARTILGRLTDEALRCSGQVPPAATDTDGPSAPPVTAPRGCEGVEVGPWADLTPTTDPTSRATATGAPGIPTGPAGEPTTGPTTGVATTRPTPPAPAGAAR